MIKVLIVEDSPTVREYLAAIFGEEPDLVVVGAARDGGEAIAVVETLEPDVITMDIHMPGVDGFEATKRIMATRPTPIVIVSGSSPLDEAAMAFRAMEAGALAAVQRPSGLENGAKDASVRQLVQTVKLMSEVKVVKRWDARRLTPVRPSASASTVPHVDTDVLAVAIGASTGGPPVLKRILSSLSRSFPAPVLVVQHMATGFTPGFAEWLSEGCALQVGLARHGEYPTAGRVYIAPEGVHLEVRPAGRLVLTSGEVDEGHRPSVGRLFRSVAEAFGRRAVGILLSGMGRDGAAELKLMRDRGALTIVQDAASSVVFGMPGEALRLNGAVETGTPERIVAILKQVARDAEAMPEHDGWIIGPRD